MTRVSRVQRAIEHAERFAAGKDPAAGAVRVLLDELHAQAAVAGTAKALIAEIAAAGWPPSHEAVHQLAEAVGQLTVHEKELNTR